MSTKTQTTQTPKVDVGAELQVPVDMEGQPSGAAMNFWTVISKDGNSYTMQNKGTGAITTVYSSECFK